MPKDKYETSSSRRNYSIMSSEDLASGKKSEWYELEISGPVRNLCPKLWSLRHLTTLYLNDNHLLRIPPDISKLTNLTYLDLSSNKLRSLPSELGDLSLMRQLLLNNNFLRNLPFELGKLFQLQTLGLQGNPLSADILNRYNEPNGTQKLLSYMLDHLALNVTQPPQRQWIPVQQSTRPTGAFTVMCYNVLCDKYCTRQLYGYCPTWALNWEYRKKGIMDEIKLYRADIISLQEVETDQFYNFFLPELKREGYNGIFSPKSRARTMSEQERKHVDGCAIFFKEVKFHLIKEYLIEFNQLAMANAEGNDEMLNRVMTKDNIGLAALLEFKEAGLPNDRLRGQPLLVATAHIHWDPEFSDVKLIQTMMLMWELKQSIEDMCRGYSLATNPTIDCNAIPLLLCGDLNSLPNSGVVEYLSTGKVAADHQDFKDYAYRSSLRKISTSDSKDTLGHNFRLCRAYQGDTMPFTNYTYDFKGVIDYIFYSRDHMNLLGLLGPLDVEWFLDNKVAGCPHPHIPSDHFSLFVELEMMTTMMTTTAGGGGGNVVVGGGNVGGGGGGGNNS
ncbi:CCR4-NOT transcription complex subunit 6-like isoform X2, partial [Argonauta hians]